MANNGNGWIGFLSQVLYYLSVVGADRDANGNYLIRGSVSTFMGMGGDNAEACVSGDTEYFSGGRACNLAAGLRGTSYGVAVHVIG